MTGDPTTAQRFRAAHQGPKPLVLANVWDAASARLIVEAGLDAVATSSGAVARSLGYEDGERTPAGEMFAAITRIAKAAGEARPLVPITADIEAGYGLSAEELVERLARAGVVGCNLEDSDPRTGAMVPPDAQAARLAALAAAARAANTGLFINARVDVHVRGDGPESTRLERSIARARLYLQAGADGVFPIMLADADDIAAYVREVPGPVNIMARAATPGLARLHELGVRRVSYGSGLHRLVQEALKAAAGSLAAGRDPWRTASP